MTLKHDQPTKAEAALQLPAMRCARCGGRSDGLRWAEWLLGSDWCVCTRLEPEISRVPPPTHQP